MREMVKCRGLLLEFALQGNHGAGPIGDFRIVGVGLQDGGELFLGVLVLLALHGNPAQGAVGRHVHVRLFLLPCIFGNLGRLFGDVEEGRRCIQQTLGVFLTCGERFRALVLQANSQ